MKNEKHTGDNTSSETGHKRVILVVDDSHTMQEVLREHLNSAGYEMCGATNARECLAILGSRKIDLVLLDIVLPDIDGLSIVKKIRSSSHYGGIPVIMLTARDAEDDIVRALEYGADDYVSKPPSFKVLLARVKTQIARKQAEEDLLEQNSRLNNTNLELISANERIETISRTDALTAISNRRHFEQVYTDEWNRALRSGSEIAVLMIDIDFFKLYNDTLGHAEGDKALQIVAGVIRSCFHRTGEIAARYGGEEFIALLPGSCEKDTLAVCETIHKKLHEKNIIHPRSSVNRLLTISIGAAILIPRREISPEILLHQADTALYQAKNSGKNKTCKFS